MENVQSSQAPVQEMKNETTTNTPEPIEMVGGESFTNFDELERVVSLPKEKAEKKTLPKEKKESKTEDSDKKMSKGDKDGKEESRKEDGKEELKEKELLTKDGEKPVKTFKAKVGDDDLDLRADSVLKVKVAGKEVDVTLNDLLSDYSGKTDWTRKYSEFAREKKQWEDSRNQLKTKLQSVTELSKTDPMGALLTLADVGEVNQETFKETFLNSVINYVQKYEAMSPEERRAHDAETQAQRYKLQAESLKQEQQNRELMGKLAEKVEALKEAHKIDNQTFYAKYQELEKLQKDGQLQAEITPDLVAQAVYQDRRYNEVSEALTSKDPKREWSNDEKWKVFELSLKYQDLTAEEIAELTFESEKTQKAQKVSSRIHKNKEPQIEKAVKAQAPKDPNREPISFDDLW